MHFQKLELMFRVTLNGKKRIKPSLTSIKGHDNRFFFVNVCRHLECAVYFVIVPFGYTLL